MAKLYFNLNISAADFLSHYNGVGKFVVTKTEDGQRLQFPANELRQFVSHSGIHGRFEIIFSRENKLLDLKKIG